MTELNGERETGSWPLANPVDRPCATLRYSPEDFEVEEEFHVDFSNDGEFDWLWIEKRGENTGYLARQLARLAGVQDKAVTYSGLKDRQALTRQWFCVHLPGKHGRDWSPQESWQGAPLDADAPGWRVLRWGRHRQKLRTGSHRGNRFVIRLRNFDGDRGAFTSRLDAVRRGFPNYFGEQRFGRDGANIEQARRWFAGDIPTPGRFEKGMLLSAARSWLFNEVLAERLARGNWDQALEGELFSLRDSGSVFSSDLDEAIQRRVQEGDIHPSGPLFGKSQKAQVTGPVADLENQIFAAHTPLCEGLLQHGLKMERRSLRVVPRDLATSFADDASLSLSFSLPRGCFATSLVRELVDYGH